MALLTHQQKRSIDLILPFAASGWVFYDSYVKKGEKDWKHGLFIAMIVFAFAYIVVSQVTRLVAEPKP